MIEFSILDTEIVVLSPILTLGPINEPEEIRQFFPIITGPVNFTSDSITVSSPIILF